jgi:hypothetical protein
LKHLSYLVKNLKIPSQLEIRLLMGSEACLLFYSQDKEAGMQFWVTEATLGMSPVAQ